MICFVNQSMNTVYTWLEYKYKIMYTGDLFNRIESLHIQYTSSVYLLYYIIFPVLFQLYNIFLECHICFIFHLF